jgi:hypothetical protein
MGGGHGPYTSVYGLGCDNVLEFQVVLTDGKIVNANEASYPDLFAAMRGGGAGTFGVMTRLTMRTFPTPTMGSASLRVSGGREAYLNAMSYFFAMTPNITDFGITSYPTMSMNSYMGSLQAPGKSSGQIQAFLNPIAARMRSFGASVTLSNGIGLALYRDDGSFNIVDPLEELYSQHKSNGTSLTKRQRLDFSPRHDTAITDMASRLLARSQLNEANIPAIKRMLSGLSGNLLPYPNLGGAVTRNRNLKIGLNPNFRDSVMLLIVINYGVAKNIAALDPLSVNHASYWNEALNKEKEWKATFWGPKTHYDELLEVKKKYDPTNTLWCFPCIGADMLTEQNGKLYISE